MVNIADYANAMGAETSIYQRNGKDHIMVTYYNDAGVKIEQGYTYYNNGKIDDSVLNKKFEWTNSWIPNGQTEAVYLGTHPAFNTAGKITGNYHSSVIIFANENSSYYSSMNAADSKITLTGNTRYMTLGGVSTATSHYIYTEVDGKSDRDLDKKTSMKPVFTNTDSIQRLIASEQHFREYYNGTLKYSLNPKTGSDTYNSNSFARGLLMSADVFYITPANSPGWNNPINVRYFKSYMGNFDCHRYVS